MAIKAAYKTRVTFSVSILRFRADGSGWATCTSEAPTAMIASRLSINSAGPGHDAVQSTRSLAVKPLAAEDF